MVTQIEKKSKKASSKKVVVVARVFIKVTGYVCYIVRSSKGDATYCTTLNSQGKATGCTCPAHKPCYHMTQLEALESERQPRQEAPQLVTIDQAMAEAQQAMSGEYDLCIGCQRRIKAGQSYCPRC